MKIRDNRGVAAFEFCLVAAPIFILMFAIFDFSRYAITMQSLRSQANTYARAMMITCYTPAVISGSSPGGCSSSKTVGSVNLSVVSASGGVLTVTASEPTFTMIMPIWGTALNAPTASTSVPY
jgi:Flp pilus assembly protein TadG